MEKGNSFSFISNSGVTKDIKVCNFYDNVFSFSIHFFIVEELFWGKTLLFTFLPR